MINIFISKIRAINICKQIIYFNNLFYLYFQKYNLNTYMYLDYLLFPFKLCLIDSEINKLTKELEVMANEFKLLF